MLFQTSSTSKCVCNLPFLFHKQWEYREYFGKYNFLEGRSSDYECTHNFSFTAQQGNHQQFWVQVNIEMLQFAFEEPVKYLLLYVAPGFPLLASFIECFNYTSRKVILCYSEQFKACTIGSSSWCCKERDFKTGSNKLACCLVVLLYC